MAEGRAPGGSIASGESGGPGSIAAPLPSERRREPNADASRGQTPATFPTGTRDELMTVPASVPTPSVYQSQELPKLNVGPADDTVRANAYVPLVPRRLRKKLLLAVTVLPPVGAAAVILFMQLTATTAIVPPPPMPATLGVVDSIATHARAQVEPAPAAPVSEQHTTKERK